MFLPLSFIIELVLQTSNCIINLFLRQGETHETHHAGPFNLILVDINFKFHFY